ncbi:MAG: AAA family ATPase, partial [Pseudomonadota bacterium]
MLNKISIQGFKSIYDIQDLELGQVNVFIGANGSGKSNFLEAIGFLSAAIDGRADARNILYRGSRHSNLSLYKSSRKGFDAQSAIKFEARVNKNNKWYSC